MSIFHPTGRRKAGEDTSAHTLLARTWSYGNIQSQVMLESVVFTLGCHVPVVLVLKKKGVVLRDNWQPAIITYHMRMIV